MLKKLLSILQQKEDSNLTGPAANSEQSLFKQHETDDVPLLALLRDRLTSPDTGRFGVTVTTGDLAADMQAWIQPFATDAQHQGLRFTLHQNQTHWQARYDAEKLRTIITNLVSNALKFTNSGGEVTVEVVYETTGLTLRICDTGIGIAAENRPAVFGHSSEVASSLDTNSRERTGGSLAQVRELIDLLAGSIGVASVVGTGTTFTIWLPLHPDTIPITQAEQSAKIS